MRFIVIAAQEQHTDLATSIGLSFNENPSCMGEICAVATLSFTCQNCAVILIPELSGSYRESTVAVVGNYD